MTYSITHEELKRRISLNYIHPVIDAWSYCSIYNRALEEGMKIIAMLDDGVVYESVQPPFNVNK